MTLPPCQLSVVVPVYNEDMGTLSGMLCAIVREARTATGKEVELVVVDDGSDEDIAGVFRDSRDPLTRVVTLTRNFGHQAAISAGLRAARGDAVIVMDADGQDPPELIPEMVNLWRAGYEIVSAVRRHRDEPPWRAAGRRWFYRALNAISEVPLTPDVGDFRLLDRAVVDAVNALPETHRYVRGLVKWVGFREVTIPYDRPARTHGASKYTAAKLARLAVDGVTSFSTWPLYLVSLCGLGLSLLAGVLVGYGMVGLLRGHAPRGWSSVFVAVAGLAGVQLLALGIVGVYVGRIYEEVKRRPAYVVRK